MRKHRRLAAMGGNADRPAAAGDRERSFAGKKVWQRIVIVVAGALMNLVLGYVLLLAYYGLAAAAPRQYR